MKASAKTLDATFSSLKELLAKYQPPLVPVQMNTAKRQYHLASRKEAVFAGKLRKEIYFGGIAINKGYVTLYYMPLYAEPKLRQSLSPAFLKLLKGKNCFLFTELTPSLAKDVRAALALGFKDYRKKGLA